MAGIPFMEGHVMHRVLLPLIAMLFSGYANAFDLQGHRGARGLAPENTLPAFAAALTLGVTTLELDTAITKDGVVVISHDPFLNPNIVRKDGVWLAAKGPAIHALTFAELQQYELGRINPASKYAGNFPEQKPADGTRFPRLSDLFALVKKSGNGAVRFNIETKVTPTEPDETLAPEPFAQILIDVIRSEGMAARATIQSFDWRTLKYVHETAADIPSVCLTAQQKFLDNIAAGKPEGSAWTAGIQLRDHGGSVPRMARAAHCKIWSPYFGDVTAEQVKEAQGLGLTVAVWTVNDPKEMNRMLDYGVDSLITDRPDVARKVMAERGLALPKATPVAP
jgi:glycerophosphoryl diester phosphodiesterase